MAFIESPRFPETISYGSSGGPEYHTTIVVTAGGAESRNADWSASRARYTVSNEVQTPAQMDTLLNYFHAVGQGRLNSFRFKDWSDYSATVSQGMLSAGVGTGLPTLQMRKRYISGANILDRDIKKPVVGSPVFYRAASPMTAGGSPGQYAIDTTTGILTMVADASQSIRTHTPGATHVFTTASDITQLTNGDKVYILGVTGTDAAALNGIAHTINSKTGAGPYTFTLATDTTGLSVNNDGTAYAYPQSDEMMTWAGEYDQPVRFDMDNLDASIDSFGTRTWSNVVLIEVRT